MRLLIEMEKQYPNQRYELFTSTKSEKNIALYQKLGYKSFAEEQVTEELRFVLDMGTFDLIFSNAFVQWLPDLEVWWDKNEYRQRECYGYYFFALDEKC